MVADKEESDARTVREIAEEILKRKAKKCEKDGTKLVVVFIPPPTKEASAD